MKNRFLILIAFIFSTAIFTGCEKDDPEIEKTAVQPMAGEWYVKYEVKDASGNYEDISGYTRVMTTSTAENTDNAMYIGDVFINPRAVNTSSAASSGEFWTYMVKANVNLGDLTFNANSKSIIIDKGQPYDINVNITDGKIIKDGSVPPSGTTTDSIVFMVQFEDDPTPGTVYRASGYRRTGFLEDDH